LRARSESTWSRACTFGPCIRGLRPALLLGAATTLPMKETVFFLCSDTKLLHRRFFALVSCSQFLSCLFPSLGAAVLVFRRKYTCVLSDGMLMLTFNDGIARNKTRFALTFLSCFAAPISKRSVEFPSACILEREGRKSDGTKRTKSGNRFLDLFSSRVAVPALV
jgi:hypothetical protein